MKLSHTIHHSLEMIIAKFAKTAQQPTLAEILCKTSKNASYVHNYEHDIQSGA